MFINHQAPGSGIVIRTNALWAICCLTLSQWMKLICFNIFSLIGNDRCRNTDYLQEYIAVRIQSTFMGRLNKMWAEPVC